MCRNTKQLPGADDRSCVLDAQLVLADVNTVCIAQRRDIRSVIDDIRSRIASSVRFPTGYYLDYGGEFESEARASRTIATLSLLAILAMAAVLWIAFRSVRDALLVTLTRDQLRRMYSCTAARIHQVT